MELNYNDQLKLKKQIDTFLKSGNNDYYEFSKEELEQIFLDNPKSVTFIKSDGKIITYNLKPNEEHYVAFLKYLDDIVIKNLELEFYNFKYQKLGFNSSISDKIKYSTQLCNILIKNNHIIIYSFLDSNNLSKMYGIKTIKTPTKEQVRSLEQFKETYNLNKNHLITNDKDGDAYFIPFDDLEKSKIR